MFPARYFPAVYFAPRYWAKVGGSAVVTLDLLQYLDSLFTAGTALATAFPGGAHFRRADTSPTRPFVAVDLLSEVPGWETESPYTEAVGVQFTIVANSIGSARTLRNTLTRHATEGIDFIAAVDLGGGAGIVTVIRTGGVTTLDTEPNPDGGEAVLATVDYVFLLSREG